MPKPELIPSENSFKELEKEKIVLMDLEGTLTPGEMYVPRDPDPEHIYRVFDGENFEVKTDLGYWSGLHLLAGEKPSEYFQRVDRWRNDQISREQFEEENTRILNKLIRRTDNDTAEEVIEWYNSEFLNLRTQANDLVKLFDEAGYKTGIISHTSQSLSIRAAEALGIDFVVPTWRFDIEGGKFNYIEKTVYADDKSEITDNLKDANVEEIVFIGNGKNDVDIAEEADRGFMIENKDGVRYKDLNAKTGDFEEVLMKLKARFGGGT